MRAHRLWTLLGLCSVFSAAACGDSGTGGSGTCGDVATGGQGTGGDLATGGGGNAAGGMGTGGSGGTVNVNCGDGEIDLGEQCDGSDLGGSTCQSLRLGGGTLACAADCTFDDTDCEMQTACGDGNIGAGETCDDGNTASGDGCDDECQTEGSACVAHATPGIADQAISLCVCAVDSFCCSDSWDITCVDEAINECAVDCGDPCVAHAGPGSNDPQLTACVCESDATCCSTAWTAACVTAAINECGSCVVAVCGNGNVEGTEQCDDSNTTSGDGCSSTCVIEVASCGNGILEGNEECDDNDLTAGDGCDALCQFEGLACVPHATPGIADETIEQCVCGLDPFCCDNSWDEICVGEVVNDCSVNCGDPCNPHPGSGSNEPSATSCVCAVVPGCCTGDWTATCVAAATNDCGACEPAVCGDGTVAFPEQCDDGNNTNNDGCNATCMIENAVCGDNDVEGAEECDDGNTAANDGCNATCQFEGFACVSHDTPGIADEAVETCVCALDSFCCNNSWDNICVNEAQNDCGVVCGDPCTVHANPGSNDTAITDCVCAGDPFCCTNNWDAQCVAEAQTDCGACNNNVCGNGILETGEECDDADTTSGDGCSAVCQFEGSVCVPHATEGADNDAVVACTCALDAFCCSPVGSWDAQCVTTASAQCAAGCGSPCTAHATVGSSNGAVTQCVCETGPNPDPYCCNTEWDSICVGEADNDCNANCP